MKYTITKASHDDFKDLILISKRVTLTNSVKFLGSLAQRFIDSGGIVNEAMANADYTYKATLDNKPVGEIAFIGNRINMLMVDPDFQRQGVGTALLEYAKGEMFKEFDEIYLDCFARNLKANSFYNARGFQLEASTYDKDLKQNLNRYVLTK